MKLRLEIDGVLWFAEATIGEDREVTLTDVRGVDWEGNDVDLTPEVAVDLMALAVRGPL